MGPRAVGEARGEEACRGRSLSGKKLFAEETQWEKERMLPGRKKILFIFLTEGQNWPFIELLGAPAILLGAPSISLQTSL